MASSDSCAIILLGNSGVGKSFLANRLLNDDQAFESRFSARSVTHQTEWKNYIAPNGSTQYLIGNLPGLMEANQKSIDENRNEIMKAFEQHPWGIILFVFGHTNGRIRDEDIVAFTRINNAYEFPSQSLLIIVNGIPSDRPSDYEERTKQLLHKITHVDDDHIYFIEKIITDENKMMIHRQLHEAIAKCKPVLHTKKHDIVLLVDEISRLKKESQQLQNQLLAQEQQQLYRQKSESITDVHQKRSQSQIELDKQISEFSEKSRQVIETTQTKHNLILAKYDEERRKSDHIELTKSAEEFSTNNERILSQIADMTPPPLPVQKESKRHILKRKTNQPESEPYYDTVIVNPSDGNILCNPNSIVNIYPNVSHIDFHSHSNTETHYHYHPDSNDDKTTRF
jgi:cell division septum initiation protein DivIVA